MSRSWAPPTTEEIQLGRRLFAEKGCASCHVIEGVARKRTSARIFPPGRQRCFATRVRRLEDSTEPDRLHSGQDHESLFRESGGAHAAIPLAPADLDAVTTALLSMTGTPATSGMQKLIVPRADPAFHPAGEFGRSLRAL